MSLTLGSVTSSFASQQRYHREVNSTIERLNAGVTVRPQDDPAGFIAYELTRSRENQLKTAGVNAQRAQAFGQTTINALDQVGAALTELQEIYNSSSNSTTSQSRIDELLATIDSINQSSEYKGQALFPGLIETGNNPATVDPTNPTDTPTPIPRIGGVQLGFADGDLVFHANQYQGRPNQGDFEVSGSYFKASAEPDAAVIDIGAINDGIVARDDAQGNGFFLYSEESVRSRFGTTTRDDIADNVIAVVYENDQFYYDSNTSLVAFTPRDSDVLLAEIDFTNGTVTSLSGTITAQPVSDTLPEAPTTAIGEPEAPHTFNFSTSANFTPGEQSLTLSSVAADALGNGENSLADLGQGAALSHATGNREEALAVISAAQQQIEGTQQEVQTFIRSSVGSLDRVNSLSLSATSAERLRLENNAGLEAASQARRLMLQSAGQSLVNQAQQTQVSTLLSLLEQTGGRSLSQPTGTSTLQTLQDAQQNQLADALTAFTEASAYANFTATPNASLAESTLDLTA